MIVAIIAVDLGLVVFCNKIWLLFNMLDHRSMRFSRFQVLSMSYFVPSSHFCQLQKEPKFEFMVSIKAAKNEKTYSVS